MSQENCLRRALMALMEFFMRCCSLRPGSARARRSSGRSRPANKDKHSEGVHTVRAESVCLSTWSASGVRHKELPASLWLSYASPAAGSPLGYSLVLPPPAGRSVKHFSMLLPSTTMGAAPPPSPPPPAALRARGARETLVTAGTYCPSPSPSWPGPHLLDSLVLR